MSAPRSAGQLRLVLISLPAGFLLLAGGGTALALGERALAASLIVLALLTVSVGLVVMFRVKVRVLQDMQHAGTEEAFRRAERPPIQ
jgi:hypothetical protein